MVGSAPRAVAADLLPHLRRARDHIDRHFEQPLDLTGLAAVAGVSKFHFARSFEGTYGETPLRYLTRRRIERAQDLLRSANLTVSQLCVMVGFASLGRSRHGSGRWSANVLRRIATGGPPGARRTCRGVTCSCEASSIRLERSAPLRRRATEQSGRSTGTAQRHSVET